VLVRAAMRSAGIVILALGFVIKSGGVPVGPADAGLSDKRPRISVFGTIHPQIFDTRLPPGAQIPAHLNVHLVSLEAPVDPGAAGNEPDGPANAPTATGPHPSFKERFASAFPGRSRGDDSFELASTGSVPVQLSKPAAAPADAVASSPMSAALSRPPLRFRKPGPVAERPADALSSPDAHARTAIYDIAAQAVYLPNGQKLEAHSGLGSKQDDPRYIRVKNQGPTPPNVYDLALRDHLFHGVRAIRLIPVDEGKMFGRDGILAHSFMLGPSGQSNGCLSFRNYPAFLQAFMRGEVERLVVVERLATDPGHRANSEWVQRTVRQLLRSS